jgi:hypothetical protein
MCASCAKEFYGDLPSGQALYTPILLDKKTGAVHDPYGVGWFAEWLRESYAHRTDAPLSFKVQERLQIKRQVVLLNCLDTVFGHSLLKLLNAQYYLDERSDVDVILLIPRFLEWMVPDGAAQVWTVDLPLQRGTEWNEWLAREIHRRLEAFESVHLSVAFSHPHPRDYDIERFTRIKPFPLDEWSIRLARPTVTFIWREDRLWWRNAHQGSAPGRLDKLKRRFNNAANLLDEQRRRVLALAEELRREWTNFDFAVTGLGAGGDLPEWIKDLRRTELDETIERAWCERYAASHIIVGLHGSNMLLPSAHAGGVIELMPMDRWSNFMQDILFRFADCREMFFRYRFLPDTTTPALLAQVLSFILHKHRDMRMMVSPEFCAHGEHQDLLRWQSRKENCLIESHAS